MKRSEWREQFPVTGNATYFNHAAVGPLSVRAAEAMQAHARDQRDWGATHWRDWYDEPERLRESAAKLINAEPHEIAILKNTSEGLSFIAKGLRWREGDNVISTSLEFPSNAVPWKRLAARGVEYREVPNRAGRFSVDDVERLIDRRTRLVTVSSVAFHNGFAADLVAIGDLCEERGVLFCVDAIQSLGVIPMDVRKAKVSFLAADGHKWLCGPEGTAIFFVAAGKLEELDVVEEGWTNIERHGKFLDCTMEYLPDSRRFEAGSLNTNGIYGLRAAIDLLLEVGVDAANARAMELARLLASKLEAIGFRIGSPQPLASPIVGAIPPDVEKTSILWLHRKLEEERIICAPREGMLRLSPHFYNDEAEVERVVEALGRLTQ
ncbi:MAG: aminotransferase class V-fold PLP-dependent enzyme [Thermoanaerobaculia bacterium]